MPGLTKAALQKIVQDAYDNTPGPKLVAALVEQLSPELANDVAQLPDPTPEIEARVLARFRSRGL